MYEAIARLCHGNGITIADMCREIDIQYSEITDIKTGRAVSIRTVVAIADYLSVSVDDLIGSYVEFLAGLRAGIPHRDPKAAMQERIDEAADSLMEIIRHYSESSKHLSSLADIVVQAAAALAELAKVTMK